MSLKVILTTLPTEDKAKEIAKLLVNKRLAACAWVLSGMRSYYIWDNTLQEDTESLLVLKVPSELADKCVKELRELHPYEVPEIMVLGTEFVLPEYLKWAKEVCGVDRS